jgi:hypothetical protein
MIVYCVFIQIFAHFAAKLQISKQIPKHFDRKTLFFDLQRPIFSVPYIYDAIKMALRRS